MHKSTLVILLALGGLLLLANSASAGVVRTNPINPPPTTPGGQPVVSAN